MIIARLPRQIAGLGLHSSSSLNRSLSWQRTCAVAPVALLLARSAAALALLYR